MEGVVGLRPRPVGICLKSGCPQRGEALVRCKSIPKLGHPVPTKWISGWDNLTVGGRAATVIVEARPWNPVSARDGLCIGDQSGSVVSCR